jgi:5-hydroxyisourate hydrolase
MEAQKIMGKLTTHILDTASGIPAEGITVKLYRLQDHKLLSSSKTNNDGRVSRPLLDGEDFKSGGYEIVFEVDDYFNANGVDSHFLKDVVVRFYVSNKEENYHVPLLLSPFSYSTYRGS